MHSPFSLHIKQTGKTTHFPKCDVSHLIGLAVHLLHIQVSPPYHPYNSAGSELH